MLPQNKPLHLAYGVFQLSMFFVGCASTEQAKPAVERFEPLSSPLCKTDEFSGSGIGESESEALAEAHSALSKQINSSVKVTTEYMASQQISGGKEDLSSKYESKTLIESALPNAHDARIASKNKIGNKINIAVCMTKSDAAKGFLERQRLMADSLEFASNTALKTGHPKRKNEAWGKTQTLWNELARIQNLLDGWGIEKASFYEPASKSYSEAREDYKEYCRNMKIHWESPEGECSNSVFSVLSGRLRIEKSECRGGSGLSLKLSCAEKCSSSSFGGVECTLSPSLSVESCGGESYLLLKSQKPAVGRDMHSAAKAKENLMEKIPSSEFFGEWENELKGWMPLCAE